MSYILIVDDEPTIGFVLGEVLSEEGFQTDIVTTGKEVLARLEKDPLPALILLDISLPDISGREILRFMGEKTRLKAIPVVVITGHSATSDKYPALGSYRDVITKPFDLDYVIEVVRRELALPTLP